MNSPNQPPQAIDTPEPNSSSVQSYLNILQSIVSRMAGNSANCKTWCITLVSGILVAIADKAKPNYGLLALIPVVLFLFLDAYYLGQERAFRATYNDFVRRLHSGTTSTSDLFVVAPLKGFNVITATLQSTLSFAIYPFYLTLIAMIAIARLFILS
ncbi:hypothetical protein [Pseudanabaena sp. ABRG5-3]|uniref:hypothetical protein n=1 Tax=Pseudanabaena sp. ABRG5-3 TaxID=685565 RepID=UPI000DC703B3|nr:hypothetical protein [Pseudanabaena sp. ABRG5-3]BBC26586.1 hypothetical protein ABRG53_a012 [Pseudanabaena sp. ABRG5-3]